MVVAPAAIRRRHIRICVGARSPPFRVSSAARRCIICATEFTAVIGRLQPFVQGVGFIGAFRGK